jgi:hypothetical protein
VTPGPYPEEERDRRVAKHGALRFEQILASLRAEFPGPHLRDFEAWARREARKLAAAEMSELARQLRRAARTPPPGGAP